MRKGEENPNWSSSMALVKALRVIQAQIIRYGRDAHSLWGNYYYDVWSMSMDNCLNHFSIFLWAQTYRYNLQIRWRNRSLSKHWTKIPVTLLRFWFKRISVQGISCRIAASVTSQLLRHSCGPFIYTRPSPNRRAAPSEGELGPQLWHNCGTVAPQLLQNLREKNNFLFFPIFFFGGLMLLRLQFRSQLRVFSAIQQKLKIVFFLGNKFLKHSFAFLRLNYWPNCMW